MSGSAALFIVRSSMAAPLRLCQATCFDQCGRINPLPLPAGIPRALCVAFSVFAPARRVIEKLIDQTWRWRDLSDREPRLSQAFQGGRERFHMSDLARHQELQRIFRSCIVGEIDEPLVNDLRSRLGCDVAAKINIKLARDLR